MKTTGLTQVIPTIYIRFSSIYKIGRSRTLNLLLCVVFFSEMPFCSLCNINIYLFDNESQTTSLLYVVAVSMEIFPFGHLCCFSATIVALQ